MLKVGEEKVEGQNELLQTSVGEQMCEVIN